MSKKIAITLLFLVILIAGLFWFNSQKNAPNPPENQSHNLEKIDIGYSRLRISLPVFVAKERGLFEKYGIDANLKMYETAQPLMQALVSGQIDVAGYTALPITYNGILRSKKDILFLSVMVEDQDHRISYLLRPKTAEGQSPSINSIKDLKGKVVGILPTIAYKAWLETMLKENGLEPNVDVIIQQVAPTLQTQSLKSGGVDALFTNDPVATSAITVGVAEPVSKTVEVPSYLGEPFPFGSFNISKEWATNNPEITKGIASALNEAILFINENPSEAKQYMIPYIPDQFKPHVAMYPNTLYLTLDQTTQKIFEDVAKQYLEVGIIKSPISFDGLVYNNIDN